MAKLPSNDVVNAAETANAAPERDLAASYAPAGRRAGLRALLALDDALAGIVRAARDPLVGQMRLTWWYGALEALNGEPPVQPVLAALAAHVRPAGVDGAALAGMVDGWELLLDREPLDAGRLAGFAAGRGGRLFAAAGAVLGAGPGDPVGPAGEGWALADLAAHVGDAGERNAAAALARERLAAVAGRRWSRAGRALGALALIARMDLAPHPAPPGAPGRVARLLALRLTGR